MTEYYARFKHVCSEEPGCDNFMDLIGFIDVPKSPIEFEEFEKLVSDRFEGMFNGTYGNYGRSYTLRDFGPVEVGKGYLVKEVAESFVER